MTAETVQNAIDAYFAQSGFDASSYTADWVDFDIGPLSFRFPNTTSRKAVVPLHDLHHAMTGYQADVAGEGEISAFEIAGGMGRHWIGWYLNSLGYAGGSLLHPMRTFRAFVRGRRSRNFYRELDFTPETLQQPAASVRQLMAIAEPVRARAGDLVAFAWWTGVTSAIGMVSLVTVMPAMVIMGLFARLTRRQDGAPSSST